MRRVLWSGGATELSPTELHTHHHHHDGATITVHHHHHHSITITTTTTTASLALSQNLNLLPTEHKISPQRGDVALAKAALNQTQLGNMTPRQHLKGSKYSVDKQLRTIHYALPHFLLLTLAVHTDTRPTAAKTRKSETRSQRSSSL